MSGLIAATDPGVLLVAAAASVTLVAFAAAFLGRTSPALLISLGVVLSPFSGNWGALGLPSGVAPDRLLFAAGIFGVLFRFHGSLRPRLVTTHWVMVAAAGYASVSALVAGTLFDSSSLFQLIDAFGILPFVLFYCAPAAFSTVRERSLLLAAFVVLGAYLSATALFEVAHFDTLVWPKYILDPTYGDAAEFGRIRGPFAAAVQNGFGLYICGVGCLLAAAQWTTTRLRVAAVLIGISCFTATFATLQRSVWLASVVASAAALLAAGRSAKLLLPAAVGVAATLVLMLALFPSLAANATHRKNDVEPVWERKNMAAAAIKMIETRPLLGFGWASFQAKSEPYFWQAGGFPLVGTHTTEHNTYLSYGAELGIAGLGLWLLAFVMSVGAVVTSSSYSGAQHWRLALIPIAVFYLVVVYFVPPPTGFPPAMMWLVAGVAWGMGKRGSITGAREDPGELNAIV